jgi:hypothetical protein
MGQSRIKGRGKGFALDILIFPKPTVPIWPFLHSLFPFGFVI